ncbi:cytochrome c oxidase subunit II [Teredinibacter sp. KSP-S5-2]|uniref:cytochrome c oxidase subunit II n=1 Tax=Teredinibacter sp. KSP-S5-2 TaxID=3034506 RepID=UPI002934A764|nr:cytochrome c oxidase subunit II [Teredinibacter sp. KSP-S5-2]WNO09187.1 cytochrome c oxidase subunit II [Teredinibacter sp. KSP-S5-2]
MLSTSKRSLALLFVTGMMMALPSFAGSNEWQLNMTEGVTSVSKNVYDLHMLILIICCVIGVLVFGAMFYSMFMHRKSRGAQASNFHESLTLEFAWTIVPVIILVAMAIPATSTLKQIYDHEDAELEVLVTGYQWKWKYEYLGQEVSFFSNLAKNSKDQIYAKGDKSQNYLLEVDEPLVIPAGVKVRFLVTAADVIHSWWVPKLAVKRDAIPGYVNAAWTKVDEPGVYRGQCAELCGKDHGYMPIEVHVVSQAEFDSWIGEKRQKALEIAEAAKQTLTFDQLIAEGESVYAAKCAACHGANGEGGVGPAMNGSKVATGELAGHLNVVLKGVAGTAMQAFAEQLTPVEAAAVITYQRNAFGNNMGDLVQPIDIVNAKQGQ